MKKDLLKEKESSQDLSKVNPLLKAYNQQKFSDLDQFKNYKFDDLDPLDSKLKNLMQKFYVFENDIDESQFEF